MDRLRVQEANGVMLKRAASGAAFPLPSQDLGWESGTWERWGQVLGDWIAYLTLTLSTILSLIQVPTGRGWPESVEIIGLVAVAAGWVFWMYTRTPQPRRDHAWLMTIYF